MARVANHPAVMVGDGINNALALAAADVGIAMGARGATASSEAADVVILVDRLDRVADASGLAAMSRAHREIQHLARLLQRLSSSLSPEDADRYLIRDAQPVIESVEALARLHNAQEEDIYEQAGVA